MKSASSKRWLGVWILGALLVIAAAGIGAVRWRIRASLPPLDGELHVAGLSAPVRVERDALGVPTLHGATRLDVARALGFLHAQDRFFQMDVLRRSGSGELAEIFGAAAVPLDRVRRLHGFRQVAAKAVALLPPEKRALLDAYTAGVNAGLAALPRAPWEYTALRVAPRPWQVEDSCLVALSLWLELQDPNGRLEQSLLALRLALGQSGVDFFAPRGSAQDAALDNSFFPEPPVPPFRFRGRDEPGVAAAGRATDEVPVGSNSFAVGARHGGGTAWLASDMHLPLAMPPLWYRAVMQWSDPDGAARRLVGVTIPGIPTLAAGSNGFVAWAFTNAYVDTADVVVLDVDATAQIYYRTSTGFKPIEDREEVIQVRGGEPVKFTARWTEWGPIISQANKEHFLALRWVAHEPAATNLGVFNLEQAHTTAEAVELAHHIGMPHQNMLIVDRGGALAWTLTGLFPRRFGHDGRYPVSWAYGDRGWDGWLRPDEIPVLLNPSEQLLWTANQRVLGTDAYTKLGDAGYYDGPRAAQIRDDLRALVASGRAITPADLLQVQLDDRAVFLQRWQKLLVNTLSDSAVATKKSRAELRDAVLQWNGHASVDSAAYRLVRLWRQKVADRVLAPVVELASARYPEFSTRGIRYEDAVWRLLQEQPPRLLNPAHASWESLLLAAADDVMDEVDHSGGNANRFVWGEQNRLRMAHPFRRILPGWIASLLDAPAQPLPGDSNMPRVQTPSVGASERFVVAPGQEEKGLFHMPGGQSGNPLSPYYLAGHDAWVKGEATPLLPGATEHTLVLMP